MTDLSLSSLNQEMIRLSSRLDGAQQDLVDSVRLYALKERDYRKARANAFRAIQESKGKTVPEKEAVVDDVTADARKERDEAEGLKQASLEAVRNFRAQLSALQSLAAAYRMEAELAGKNYEGAA